MGMKIGLPNKYHVKYEEFQKDTRSSDDYMPDYVWVEKTDEYDNEPAATLGAINLVVERQKYQANSGDLRSGPQEHAVRKVRVTEETRKEEILREIDYATITAQVLAPVRNDPLKDSDR